MSVSDRCPFGRPFDAGFDDCQAFQPILFEPIDTGRRPLGETWTCRNLDTGSSGNGRFYPRCRLGDERARAAWFARYGDRARRLRKVRRALVESVRQDLDRFLTIQRGRTPGVELQRELRVAGQRLIDALHAELDRQRPELDAIGLDRDTAASILRDMVLGWESSPTPVVSLEAAPGLIARYPDAKDLLAPG